MFARLETGTHWCHCCLLGLLPAPERLVICPDRRALQSVPAAGCVAVPFNFVFKSFTMEARYIAASMPAGCSDSDLRWVPSMCGQPAPQCCVCASHGGGRCQAPRVPGHRFAPHTSSALAPSPASLPCSISKLYMGGTCTSERNNKGIGCSSDSNGTVVPNTYSSSIDPSVCLSVFADGPSSALFTLTSRSECLPCQDILWVLLSCLWGILQASPSARLPLQHAH